MPPGTGTMDAVNPKNADALIAPAKNAFLNGFA